MKIKTFLIINLFFTLSLSSIKNKLSANTVEIAQTYDKALVRR
jgi:hypothetical protein